jgi:Protein of unknown function (DUF4242)
MPTFIDRHPFAAVPRAVRRQMYLEAMRGLVDEHGAQPLGYWLTDGAIYCVLRAPREEAFCRHHADRGLPCDDVHPIAGADMDIVRAVIAELWPGDQRVRVASRSAAASTSMRGR